MSEENEATRADEAAATPTPTTPPQTATGAMAAAGQVLARHEGAPLPTSRENPNPLWAMELGELFDLRKMPTVAVWGLSQALSNTTLVDPKLQGKPANVFMLLLKAAALKVDVPTALDNFHIIETKDRWGNVRTTLSIAAHLQFALVQKSGVMKVWRYSYSDDQVAKIEVQRIEWDHPITVEFTIEEARRMNLVSGHERSPWTTQPANMLRRRVTTRAAREHAGDVVIAYDMEELDDATASVGTQAAPTWSPAPRSSQPIDVDDDIPDLSVPPAAPAPAGAGAPTRTGPIDFDGALAAFARAAEAATTRAQVDDAQERYLSEILSAADAGDRAAKATAAEASKIYETHYKRLRK